MAASNNANSTISEVKEAKPQTSSGTLIADIGINAQLPQIFDGSANWKIWKAKLSLYFDLKNLTSSDERQKRSVLLSLLSEKIFDDVFGEFGEAAVSSTPYADVMAYLDRIYGQAKNLTSNRHDFHRMTESVEGPLKFLRDLKNKSLACDFRSITDFVDFSISMVYTMGIQDANLRFLLLKEPNLTAIRAEEITRQYLSTTEAVRNLGTSVKIGGEVHQCCMQNGENYSHIKRHNGRSYNKPGKLCYTCNKPGHVAAKCPNQQYANQLSEDSDSDCDY